MASWYEYAQRDVPIPIWPYPIRYEKEQEIETDILVLGGGIAGCWGRPRAPPGRVSESPWSKRGNGKKRFRRSRG